MATILGKIPVRKVKKAFMTGVAPTLLSVLIEKARKTKQKIPVNFQTNMQTSLSDRH